jgi:hypothetical protein
MREVLMIAALVIISFVFLLQLSENIMLVIRAEEEEKENERKNHCNKDIG